MKTEDLNGHYCLATKEHYDKLIEDGVQLYDNQSSLNIYRFVIIKNNKIMGVNIIGKATKMHLHNKEWVKGSLEHEEDKLRGHSIINIKDKWFYIDTMEPTEGNIRSCGECGKNDTKEGHDGCLGTIPNIMNACYGHGTKDEAYIQFLDGNCITGEDALEFINKPKPIERITREDAHIELGRNSNYMIWCNDHLLIDNLFDYIEQLESNQKIKDENADN